MAGIAAAFLSSPIATYVKYAVVVTLLLPTLSPSASAITSISMVLALVNTSLAVTKTTSPQNIKLWKSIASIHIVTAGPLQWLTAQMAAASSIFFISDPPIRWPVMLQSDGRTILARVVCVASTVCWSG